MLVLQCLFIVSIGCESNQRDTSMNVLRGSSRTISVSVAYARQPAEPAWFLMRCQANGGKRKASAKLREKITPWWVSIQYQSNIWMKHLNNAEYKSEVWFF